MEEFRTVLLDVWREACRHIEISQSTETIAAMLAKHVPIAQVLVRQIDPAGMRGDRGDGRRLGRRPAGATPAANAPAGKWNCSWPGASWARQPRQPCPRRRVGNVGARRRRGRRAGRSAAASADGRWAVLGAGRRRRGRTSSRRHAELVQLLLEPFSIALGNHHRLSEMAALREAAEADKRSLLNRLGRSKLGDTIVGVESGLQAVMERVELVARSDVPVLIFGETGSGKELVARAIHNRSPRANGPFIRVNCGAIPHELIDSQLFGHEKGAFTGAVETRKGWFERADGGTLLLDELGELTLAAQVRLLRILQDGWLDRVGSQRPISVDVRIVAATHRDLAAMVAEGRFREDLWYRIAVFPIRLPPLRERREDIPELARHFAGRAATRFGLYPAMPDRRRLGPVEGIPLAGERPRVGHGDRPRGDPRRRQAAGGGHGVGHRGQPHDFVAGRGAETRAGVAIAAVVRARGHCAAGYGDAPAHRDGVDGRVGTHRGSARRAGCCGSIRTRCGRVRKLGIDWKQFRRVEPGPGY